MTMTFHDLQAYTGTEVRGVDLSQPMSDADRATLSRKLADRGVLVFHDQMLDAPAFTRAIANFGPLMPQQSQQFCLPDNPMIGFVSNRDVDRATGVKLVRGEQYHTDHSNYEAPPRATALHGIEIPTHGGDTQFVNVQAAYDELPAATKARIDTLRCLHVGQSSRSPRRLATPEPGRKRSEALQPLVTQHPVNGRRGLYLNTARMEHVIGLADEEGHALIAELMATATDPRYEYRHRWRRGDVVIWDNLSVMHQANGDVPPDQYRFLHRLMVTGEPLRAAA